jgi:hypothetical protein
VVFGLGVVSWSGKKMRTRAEAVKVLLDAGWTTQEVDWLLFGGSKPTEVVGEAGENYEMNPTVKEVLAEAMKGW